MYIFFVPFREQSFFEQNLSVNFQRYLNKINPQSIVNFPKLSIATVIDLKLSMSMLGCLGKKIYTALVTTHVKLDDTSCPKKYELVSWSVSKLQGGNKRR